MPVPALPESLPTAFLTSTAIAPATFAALAAALAKRHTPPTIELPIDLPAAEASTVYRLGARWAAAVAHRITCPSTLRTLLIERREARKTVLAAAATNPHLPADVVAHLLKTAVAGRDTTAVAALMNQRALPVLDAITLLDTDLAFGTAPILDADRFSEADLEVALAHHDVTIAASALRATCTPGSPTDSDECRRAAMALLSSREDSIKVGAQAFSGAFRRPAQWNRCIVGADAEFWVRALCRAKAIKDVTWTPAAGALMWAAAEAIDVGPDKRPVVLAKVLAATSIEFDALERAAAHPALAVRRAVVNRIHADRARGLTPHPRTDKLIEQLARTWDGQDNDVVGKLIAWVPHVSDTALVNLLRHGNSQITADWLGGALPVSQQSGTWHRPTAEMMSALVADPGFAFWSKSALSQDPEVVAASATRVTRRPAPRTEDKMADLLAAVAQLPDALRCSGDTLRGAALAALTEELGRQAPANIQTWALATELAPSWEGTVAELVAVSLAAAA